MKRIALVGFGVENRATYRFLSKNPDLELTICDQNEAVGLPEGATARLGSSYLENLDEFDQIIRTVGMHPSVILAKNPEVAHKISTAVNLFFENCKTPIIGVTGTKGKGTTSTLIAKILEASGKNVVLAGNIGTPMLDMLDKAAQADYVVLELSSFQLSDVRYSPQTAVCLMVVPEHLNWHTDMEDYKHAKQNIFRFQRPSDRAVYNSLNENSVSIASASAAEDKLTYAVGDPATELADAYVAHDAIYYHNQEICKTSEVRLLGRHNLENICAAVAATYDLVGGNAEPIRSVLSTFSGLPHRLELVRELNGVQYYDDSFSTTPETAIAAIKAFSSPKILILGGSDKGIPFDELADVAAKEAKHVLAIGKTGEKIAELLRERGFNDISREGLTDMQSIIAEAQDVAEPGDIVLLSTGAASFDMFKDYKDRAAQFQDAVKALR